MNSDELTDEQKERVRVCKTPEEIMELAERAGYELSDDELEAISGGDWDCLTVCKAKVECNTLCIMRRMPLG